MFEVTIKRVCKSCAGTGRVTVVIPQERKVLCALCDGRGYKELTMVVSASSMSEAEELVRTDGYRQGVFDSFKGDLIVLVVPVASNLYLVRR